MVRIPLRNTKALHHRSDAAPTGFESCPSWDRTRTLLIQSQAEAGPANVNLSVSRGKPGVGAGLGQHSRRSLPRETAPQTAPKTLKRDPLAVANVGKNQAMPDRVKRSIERYAEGLF